AAAGKDLDDEGLFNIVTDAEALHALDLLISLPPGLQGKAIAKLPDDRFENLLDEVPRLRRNDFESLVKNTTDPKRKLLLWREYYKAHATVDAESRKGDVGEEVFSGGTKPTAAQAENRRREDHRRAAAEDSQHEADEEASFLLHAAESGTALSLATVQGVIDRKDLEHEIEMKYNIDITNKAGARADGSQIVWKTSELQEFEASFAQVPVEHMAGNKLLKELRRDDMDVEDGHVKPNIGGTHDDGVVTVFDDGAQVIGTGYRHGGDARELASPYICSLCGAQIAILDMVITHEMGHDFHDQRPEIFKAYQKAAGWQSLEKSDISAAGLGDEDIEKLELTRKEPYAARNQVHKHGKIYMVDPYEKKKYLVVDETAIPTGAESEPASGGGDSWNYARSNYKDAFAEHYAKAVHVPQKLYKDLIETPASLVVSKQAIFDLSDQALKALDPTRNTPAEYAQAQRDLRSAQAEL